MKKKIFLITTLVIALFCIFSLTISNYADAKTAKVLPSGDIQVKNTDGSSQSGAVVTLKLNGIEHKDSPQTSNSQGWVNFDMTDEPSGNYSITADYQAGFRSGSKTYYYNNGIQTTDIILNIFY